MVIGLQTQPHYSQGNVPRALGTPSFVGKPRLNPELTTWAIPQTLLQAPGGMLKNLELQTHEKRSKSPGWLPEGQGRSWSTTGQ